VRTVPVPDWTKARVDDWTTAAEITNRKLFRSIRKNGALWGDGLTQNVVREAAKRASIDRLAPMICVAAAGACATWLVVNWNKFNFFSGMRRSRRLNAISAASSEFVRR